MRYDELAETLDAIHTASLDHSRWSDTLDRVCRTIGAQAAITVPRVAVERTVALPYSRSLDEFAWRFVTESWYERDYRADRGWPMTDHGQSVVLEQDIIAPEEHNSLPMHNELMKPFELNWWAGITFRTLHGQYVLSVFRSERAGAFTDDDRKVFEVLSSHLGRAVTISERLGQAQNEAGLAILEARGEAALFLDASGQVLEMTSAAEPFLANAITLVGRSLILARKSDQRKLQAMISAALRTPDSGALEGPIRIRGKDGSDFLLDVAPVPQEMTGPFIFTRLLLLLVDLKPDISPRSELLAKVFGLTTREIAIISGLIDGLSLAEIGDRHAIARETVRSHLKSAFLKTGTNRQSALVSLALRTMQSGVGRPDGV